MNVITSGAVSAAILTIFSAPAFAEEQFPDCTEATIGVQCVEMRSTIGPWSLEERVPPVGSQNALVMISTSFRPVPGLFGREESAQMILSCVENTTRIEVQFGENFMSDVGDFANLVYRIDDLAPVVVSANASADNTALGLYEGNQAIPLIRSMFEAERLSVNATSFTGRSMSVTFSIEGLAEAVEPLRELCNW